MTGRFMGTRRDQHNTSFANAALGRAAPAANMARDLRIRHRLSQGLFPTSPLQLF